MFDLYFLDQSILDLSKWTALKSARSVAKAGDATYEAAQQEDDGLQPALRPKTLSQEAEDYLRALGRKLRQARPILKRDVVAAREAGDTVLAGRVNRRQGGTTPNVAQ